MIGALVLAGGRSSRFGREKALVDFAGEPMIARVLRVLADGAEQVAVSANEGSQAYAYALANGLEVLPDGPVDPQGPLAGILTGLRWAVAKGYAGLVTAPCDAPLLPQDLVSRLQEGGVDRAGFACTRDGLEPLCAFWPASMLPGLEGLASHPSLRAMLLDVGAAKVTFSDASAFANLNTPYDLTLAEARLCTR